MSKKPVVSVVLGSYNRLRLIKYTIESVREELDGFPHEMIVVDGGSTDGALKWLIAQKDIITIVQHNHGEWMGKPVDRRSWGYYMNLGFKAAQGKYVCMLSDDSLVVPGAIVNGYKLFEERTQQGQKLGGVAFYFRDLPFDEDYRVSTTFNKVFVNHGLFSIEAIKDVGYIDEDNFQFYHADTDLCLRMWQKGYQIVDSPNSFIEHYMHANLRMRKANSEEEGQYLDAFLNKWRGIFYDGQSGNIGGTIRVKFQDSTHSALKFRQALPITARVRDLILVSKRAIGNKVKFRTRLRSLFDEKGIR